MIMNDNELYQRQVLGKFITKEDKLIEPLYYNGYISLDERVEIREYIEELNKKIKLQANALKEKDEMLNNRNGVIQHLNLRIDKTIEYITKEYYKEHTTPLENLRLENCDYEPSLVALSILQGKEVK